MCVLAVFVVETKIHVKEFPSYRLLTTTSLPFPTVQLQQQQHRGTYTDLHALARKGKCGAIRTWGAVYDVDQVCQKGFTPLHYTAMSNFPKTAKALLNLGASVSIAGDGGATALHCCVQRGHVGVAKVLIRAGSDLEAMTTDEHDHGNRPLHFAVRFGHTSMVIELVKAGANVNCRGFRGYTPIIMAAIVGNRKAARVLLYAEADPLLSTQLPGLPKPAYPLDVAAYAGSVEVVRDLLHVCGIDGCGGEGRGVLALAFAAKDSHLETLAALTSAGVVDDGSAIAAAVDFGHGAVVRYLLQHHEGLTVRGRPYVDSICGPSALSPLLRCVTPRLGPGSSKIAQILIAYEADTTSPQMHTGTTPLEVMDSVCDHQDVTETRRLFITGIRRLVLQADAIRALSWTWPVELTVPWVWPDERADRAKLRRDIVSQKKMLPVVWCVASRPRVLFAAQIR